MQFFDPQQIGQDIQPNQQDNTVDVHWTLVEKVHHRFSYKLVTVVTHLSEL